MSDASLADFVEETFRERDLGFDREIGPCFRLPHGSAEVILEFDDLGGGAVIRVSAVVLDELDVDEEREEVALRALNDRNRSLRFGKFTWESATRQIRLEYDLLGDYLQPEELMNAVAAVARLADDHDDLLRDELGSGRRASDR